MTSSYDSVGVSSGVNGRKLDLVAKTVDILANIDTVSTNKAKVSALQDDFRLLARLLSPRSNLAGGDRT